MNLIYETLHDTIIILPLLFFMYLGLEFIEEHFDKDKTEKILSHFGPILGAIFGVIPQCGFGVLASFLFIEGRLTLGTLISVFISTSDEMLPILLTNPSLYDSLLYIIIVKIVVAIIVGYLVDFIFHKYTYTHPRTLKENQHEHSFIKETFLRTLKIYIYIFIINLGLSALIEWISFDTLSALLLTKSPLQPLLSSLIGFIPNCASSVILTELFVNKMLTLPSLVGGLITNAGLGLLVLFQEKIEISVIIKIVMILFLTAITVSFSLQLFL